MTSTLKTSQFVRITERERAQVEFFIDGHPAVGLCGDTLLTAVMLHARRLRNTEFTGEPRGGFCLMGACQDCWVQLEGGRRVRACSTLIANGMRVVTQPLPAVAA
jgi:aerobic-type carbon monoxide dehydrogenase small subunit (CoxS/CutS family)